MRRLVALVYALVVVTELVQAAIFPLLPLFAREFTLTRVETGAVLSIAMFTTVLVAVPSGRMADRFGARRVAVAAGVVLATSALVQGLAVDFWMLLLGRAGYGVAFGAVWTAGLAVIAESTGRSRASAIGGTVAVGGIAHLVGPGGAGVLADLFGVAAPFALTGAAAFAVTLGLALASGRGRERLEQPPLLAALETAAREQRVRGALALIAVVGVTFASVQLLVPLELAENGLSAGAIGLLFSAAAAVWIVASGVFARLGDRVVTLRVAGLGTLVYAVILLIPTAALTTAALAGFLLLRQVVNAPLSTLCYPLAERGGRAVGIGGGTVLGIMNVSWGVATVAGPLLGGALADLVGVQATFGALAAVCLLAGLWLLLGPARTHGRLAPDRDHGDEARSAAPSPAAPAG